MKLYKDNLISNWADIVIILPNVLVNNTYCPTLFFWKSENEDLERTIWQEDGIFNILHYLGCEWFASATPRHVNPILRFIIGGNISGIVFSNTPSVVSSPALYIPEPSRCESVCVHVRLTAVRWSSVIRAPWAKVRRLPQVSLMRESEQEVFQALHVIFFYRLPSNVLLLQCVCVGARCAGLEQVINCSSSYCAVR